MALTMLQLGGVSENRVAVPSLSLSKFVKKRVNRKDCRYRTS